MLFVRQYPYMIEIEICSYKDKKSMQVVTPENHWANLTLLLQLYKDTCSNQISSIKCDIFKDINHYRALHRVNHSLHCLYIENI